MAVIAIKRGWENVEREAPKGRRLQFVGIEGKRELLKDTPPWMTVRYVADYLGIHSSTIYEWISQKRLGAQKLGKTIRIHRDHLAEFLATEEVA